MNNNFEPLDNGEVLSISESALIYIGHTTFRVGEFSEAVRSQLEHNTEGWNEGKNSWFTDMGVDCEVLRFTSGGWQKGKVRLRLEFAPEDGSSGGTTQNTSAQPSAGGIEIPPAISVPDTISPPTDSHPTDSQITEDSVASTTSTSFADVVLPVAVVVGTAVVGGIALSGENDDASPEATLTSESELASLDEGDFDLDSLGADVTNLEESDLEAMTFAEDDPLAQSEANILENDDFDLESSNADVSGLESGDFNLETSDIDLLGLEDVDFALEENPLGDTLEEQENISLEDAEFDLGITEADLSGLAEDDFSLSSIGDEESNLETPDFSLETSLMEQELVSLDDGDFALESTVELELESLGSTDLSSLGAEDFEATSDSGLFAFGDEEFTSETANSEEEMGGLGDFEFAAAANDDFSSMEENDFGTDNLDTDFSGLENADFGEDSADSMSFLESTETSSLEDEFGLETPEFSSAVSEAEEPDFGLDELLGDNSDGEDLEFLSISDQDKQEFEQAAAAVSQAFDDDFGLELESKNGLDNFEFDFAGDDEVDAIDKQLADTLGDDLDLLGTSEGLTENLFAEQDDALFKDVWEDINKSQVK